MSSLITPKPVKVLQATKPLVVSGTAYAEILMARPAGVVRDKNNETYEAEWILVVSRYGRNSQLDLNPITEDSRWPLHKREPGQVKYYLVRLHKSSVPRKVGGTPIACEHLARSKSFDDHSQAVEAFLNA